MLYHVKVCHGEQILNILLPFNCIAIPYECFILFIYSHCQLFIYVTVYQEVNDSGIVTLNCIIAKQVCIDDPLCGPTLDIVDRVCGSEVGKLFHVIIHRGGTFPISSWQETKDFDNKLYLL